MRPSCSDEWNSASVRHGTYRCPQSEVERICQRRNQREARGKTDSNSNLLKHSQCEKQLMQRKCALIVVCDYPHGVSNGHVPGALASNANCS